MLQLFNAHYFDLRSDKKSSYGYEAHKMCAESALTTAKSSYECAGE